MSVAELLSACPTSEDCVAVGGSLVTGKNDIILASLDGGSTWGSRTSDSKSFLFGVTCPSSRTCLAVGGQGTILESANGAGS